MAAELSRQGEAVAAPVLLGQLPCFGLGRPAPMDEDAVLRTMLMADGDHGTEGLGTATPWCSGCCGRAGPRPAGRTQTPGLVAPAGSPREPFPPGADALARRTGGLCCPPSPHLGLDPACWAPHADLA